ncbi:MAG: riboflavin synthase [Candidatus Omnitrophica bacterium]|nr:riboflavin synthase [Candidatus Omnitrophota bacterium]
MFTGIIEKTADIRELKRGKKTYRLVISVKGDMEAPNIGDSVAVSGVCLTVISAERNNMQFDIIEETFKNTLFSHLKKNDVVNVERALKWQSRLEGHFVLGHVDTVQKIGAIKKHNRPYIDIIMDPKYEKYIVEKGSVAIDGISLTVNDARKDGFRAYLIPHTMLNTSLRHKNTGSFVNIEFDILGKYVADKYMRQGNPGISITETHLKNTGFI